MPKQIKQRKITGGEKAGCVMLIITMIIGLLFAAAFIIFIPDIESDSRGLQLSKAAALAGGYVLFILMSTAAAVVCLVTYKKSSQAGDLMRGFFAGMSAFLALLCVRFMLALFFSGLDKTDLADKVIGDNTYSQFIENQAPAFACLVIGLSVMLFAGISGIVKLAKR